MDRADEALVDDWPVARAGRGRQDEHAQLEQGEDTLVSARVGLVVAMQALSLGGESDEQQGERGDGANEKERLEAREAPAAGELE